MWVCVFPKDIQTGKGLGTKTEAKLEVLPNLKKIVTSAILNRRRLLIKYGHKPQTRVIEPYLLFGSDSGASVLLCYQVRGYSSKDRPVPFWRPFQLAKIDHVVATEEIFTAKNSKDYGAILSLAAGQIQCSIDHAGGDYNYFNPAIYGPPPPGRLSQRV